MSPPPLSALTPLGVPPWPTSLGPVPAPAPAPAPGAGGAGAAGRAQPHVLRPEGPRAGRFPSAQCGAVTPRGPNAGTRCPRIRLKVPGEQPARALSPRVASWFAPSPHGPAGLQGAQIGHEAGSYLLPAGSWAGQESEVSAAFSCALPSGRRTF